jgi:LCP family protein required for cell wall assembly
VISIPRDVLVDVPGHGPQRINAAYGLAWLAKADPLLAVQEAVEGVVGLPVHHTVAVDLALFERLVDAVGGVNVVVPCGIEDNFIDARTDTGRRRLEVQPGMQHMDGPTAAMYVRSRHGRSDWSRTRRQQAVLLALQRELAKPSGLLLLPELLAAAEGAVETNMSRLELIQLARAALQVRLDRLHGVVLDWKETEPFRTEDNRSVLLPRPEAIQRKLADAFSAPSPGRRTVQTPCLPPDIALQHNKRKQTSTDSEANIRRQFFDRFMSMAEL